MNHLIFNQLRISNVTIAINFLFSKYMDRRSFVKKTAVASVATLGVNHLASAANPNNEQALLKPKKLKKGDTIGLVAPASAATRNAYEKAVENIGSLGFNVKTSDNARIRKGFLAGNDEHRLKDLHAMFEDESVDGIMCIRGGYGSGRLLTQINYNLIKANVKVLIGYSDITALLYGIHKNTGLVCFHGPVGASEFSDFTQKSFEDVLIKGKKSVAIKRPKQWNELTDKAFESIIINQGTATGQLIGGNLSLMTSVMGTPYDIAFDNKIVFIEEIGESPYRLDRMITQLLNSGKLDLASGLVLGVFKGCETSPDDPDYALSVSMKEVLMDRFGGLKIPVIYGMPIGHIDDNATLPIGISAELNADKGALKLLESAVV